MAAHEHVPNAFHHVLDTRRWEFFDRLFGGPVEWNLPAIPLPWGGSFQFTKFMMLELIAAGLILLIYIPLSRRATSGELPKGWRWNMFESLLTFVRNEIARPNLGGTSSRRSRQIRAFLVDAVPVHSVLQPARHVPLWRIAYRQHLHDGRLGDHRFLHDSRLRHRQDGAGPLCQIAVAAH